jgi:hypothetical protein
MRFLFRHKGLGLRLIHVSAVVLIGGISCYHSLSWHSASADPTVPSGTLASETFEAPAGPLNALAGGSGWAAPWEIQNGSVAVPGYNTATAAPLTFAGVSQSGNYATGGAGWIASGRTLDTGSGGNFSQYLNGNLIGQSGKTLFFGLLMRKDMNTDDEMSVTLHAGASPAWWVNVAGVAVGHFGGASNTAGTRYWSLRVDGVVHQTTVPVVVGQAALLVLRLDFGATTTASLFVNPPPAALPSTAGASATTSSSLAFRSVAYYGGPDPNQSSVDELRFAASYSGLAWGSTPPPAAPSNLTALAGDGQVILSWTSVPGVSAWQIFKMVGNVPQLEGTAASNAFTATGLTNGVAYTFYVVSVVSGVSSAPSAQVTSVPRGVAPAAHARLGTNLAQLADWSRELPFVDAFKSARPWISQLQGASWGSGPALALDANGWITSLQPGQYAETIMFDNALDDQPDYPTGQYTLLYDGEGTIAFDLQSASIVSQTPGRMVVQVPGGVNGIYLMLTATNPANPLRNLRFILPGFESTYASQPFHPLFLQRLQSYRVLRYMEWMLTNGSSQQNWSDRPQPADYTYGWRGVPLEVLVQLANQLNVTPWFNIPAQATDAYVQSFATLVLQQLNTSLKFYLEYSNETWNGSFSQNAWIRNQGTAAGLSTDPTLATAYYTASRSVQIFNIVGSVPGGTGRMIRVIGSQAANSWLSDQMLGFQNAFGHADALAIAPYFNCDDTSTGGFGVLGDPATASQVAAMTPDQIIDIQLAHINGCALRQMQSNAAVAQKYGLLMVGYEGGQSLVGYNGVENNATVTGLFKTANRSTRMTALYAQYLQNWVAAGGDLFVHFSDVTAFTKWGAWGALEYQGQDPNTAPKYRALVTFSAQHP